MADIEPGMDPENELEAKDRFFNEIKLPMEGGISPWNSFEERFKLSNPSSMVTEVGMLPLRWFPDKSTWERLECIYLGRLPVRLALEMVKDLSFFMCPRMTKGPEALTGTSETVRSVRFSSLESQTPESLWRLLMQVKERREEMSSGGKRMGVTGQFESWRLWRVERDLRAV